MFLFSGMLFVRYIWLLLLGCISLGTENNICRRWIVCMCVCACITQTVNLPLWSQYFPIFFSLQNKTPWEKLLLLSLLLKLCIRHSSACPAVFLTPSPKVLASFLWQSKDCHHHHSCIAFFAFFFKTGLPTWPNSSWPCLLPASASFSVAITFNLRISPCLSDLTSQ